MNLDPFVVPRHEAQAKLAEYTEAARESGAPEDAALARAYRQTLKGRPVISLSETIHAGGYFGESGLPRLAVVRADAGDCFLEIHRWGGVDRLTYSSVRHPNHLGGLVGKRHVRVRVPGPLDGQFSGRQGQTIVPLTPPRHRPARPRLSSCHVLWEVEAWTDVAPVDPALLRYIHGDLWAVLATWDLTPLERAVLPLRRRP